MDRNQILEVKMIISSKLDLLCPSIWYNITCTVHNSIHFEFYPLAFNSFLYKKYLTKDLKLNHFFYKDFHEYLKSIHEIYGNFFFYIKEN